MLRIFLVTAAAAVASAVSLAQPASPTNAPHDALLAAAAAVSAKLTPAQRSIVRGLPKDSLTTLMGEWGEDIQKQFSLTARDASGEAAARLCQRRCTTDEATLLVMETVWESLRK